MLFRYSWDPFRFLVPCSRICTHSSTASFLSSIPSYSAVPDSLHPRWGCPNHICKNRNREGTKRKLCTKQRERKEKLEQGQSFFPLFSPGPMNWHASGPFQISLTPSLNLRVNESEHSSLSDSPMRNADFLSLSLSLSLLFPIQILAGPTIHSSLHRGPIWRIDISYIALQLCSRARENWS